MPYEKTHEGIKLIPLPKDRTLTIVLQIFFFIAFLGSIAIVILFGYIIYISSRGTELFTRSGVSIIFLIVYMISRSFIQQKKISQGIHRTVKIIFILSVIYTFGTPGIEPETVYSIILLPIFVIGIPLFFTLFLPSKDKLENAIVVFHNKEIVFYDMETGVFIDKIQFNNIKKFDVWEELTGFPPEEASIPQDLPVSITMRLTLNENKRVFLHTHDYTEMRNSQLKLLKDIIAQVERYNGEDIQIPIRMRLEYNEPDLERYNSQIDD
ncbi:MAG: hypothetical protein ACXAD7_26325 [Candidatus Kariarchaeaceae archaeon]|jgi:hypothetical protein